MLRNAIPGGLYFQCHSWECITSNSPKTPKRVTEKLWRSTVQEAFANLSLSGAKREDVTCLCYYLPLNYNPEAQCHVRETKTGSSCLLVKAAPDGDSVAPSTQTATANPLLSFHMSISDNLHAQHSSHQHWHLQHWNGTLWKPWHWTQTFRRAPPLWTTPNTALNSCCNQWYLKSIFQSEHCSMVHESVRC